MKLGLTGRIACGKSTVSKVLLENGFQIIDCDRIAHVLLLQDDVKASLRRIFGDGIFINNEVSRPVLGHIVFSDIEARRALEKVMRPRVHCKVFEALLTEANQVVDCFEIIDTPIQSYCFETWLVTCPPEQQLQRLIRRNQLSVEDAKARIAAQMPEEKMKHGADVIIDNSRSMFQTELQVHSHLKRLGFLR